MDIYEADDNSTPLTADLVLQKLEGKTLYWGDTNLVDVSEVRRKYIDVNLNI